MAVVIRVDASRLIGTGHLRRTLSLAHALTETGVEPVFLTRVADIDSASAVRAEGFRVISLPPAGDAPGGAGAGPYAHWLGVDLAQDAVQTIKALAAEHVDWIVVDHYAIDATWHRAVATALGARICVIDDLADRNLACEVVVDHNVAADPAGRYAARVADGAAVLAGPRYALLGATFVSPEMAQVRDAVRSVGIFMGGVDLGDHTSTVLEALDGVGFEGEIEIVTTRANPHLARLEKAVALRPGTRLSVDLPDLASFFARHDVQVGAGGGATWERCRVGAPTLLLVVAENQRRSSELLAQWGVVATTAPAGETSLTAIKAALAPLLSDPGLRGSLSRKASELVDGLGARRVALKIAASTLTVRPASLGDAGLIHQWRDHPATRAVSRDGRSIPFADHYRWLEGALNDVRRTILIGEVGQVPVGVVRFDQRDDHSAEASIYLDPALHGLGLGRALLLAAESAAPPGLDIVAETLEDNDASQRLFASVGYDRLSATQWIKPAAAGGQRCGS